MQVNEGKLDRLGRLVLAIIIIGAFLTDKLPGQWALLLLISGAFLMSFVTGFCPLYTLLGINTCKK